jgi:hypothetical protein
MTRFTADIEQDGTSSLINMSDSPFTTAGIRTVATEEWLEANLVSRLEREGELFRAARTFSGSIGFKIGRKPFTFGVYEGRIVHFGKGRPLTGLTFGISGDEEAWTDLISAPRNQFLRLFHGGRLRAEGNLVEFLRLTEATLIITDTLRVASRVR